jgi:hypothetical protein
MAERPLAHSKFQAKHTRAAWDIPHGPTKHSLPAASPKRPLTAPESEDANPQPSSEQSVKPHPVAKEADRITPALVTLSSQICKCMRHYQPGKPSDQSVQLDLQLSWRVYSVWAWAWDACTVRYELFHCFVESTRSA